MLFYVLTKLSGLTTVFAVNICTKIYSLGQVSFSHLLMKTTSNLSQMTELDYTS